MKYFGSEFVALHKKFSAVIRKKGNFSEAKELFFQIHSQLHSADVYGTGETEFDRLICGINDENRSSVGRRTREIVSAMTEADAKRKFPTEYKDKLFDCDGLTSHPDSAWLADYRLSKDCTGSKVICGNNPNMFIKNQTLLIRFIL